MAKVDRFQDLNCWKAARELTALVYALSRSGALWRDFNMRDQVRSAALSSMSNIAEGFRRMSDKEFIRFVEISTSSADEVQSCRLISYTRLGVSPMLSILFELNSNLGSLDRNFIRVSTENICDKLTQIVFLMYEIWAHHIVYRRRQQFFNLGDTTHAMRTTCFPTLFSWILLFVLTGSTSCEKSTNAVDPCSNLIDGYVIGFNQCLLTKGFVVTTISPPDTMVTYNLPDDLYHFPSDANDVLYNNYINDFLFPASFAFQFPISFSYEIVPEADRKKILCSDNIFVAHFVHTVKNEIKINCATK